MNALERAILAVAPSWANVRAQARARAAAAALAQRHYEAAASGRRTENWSRRSTDANAAASGNVLSYLRAQARDLVRNNPWAKRGLRRIAVNTVGWGIRPKPGGAGAKRIAELWKAWGETTDCDAAGRLTFYGLQRQVMMTVAEAGEVLVRRRFRRPSDGLSIPMQLQLLEPDYLDATKDGIIGQQGGPIIQGVEFDAIGRRTAYWLFAEHPGSGRFGTPVSSRYAAEDVLHVFYQERPGQVRGPSWFAPVDVRLHDFDEYEDATLMRQKIAACFAAFVTDVDGTAPAIGEPGSDAASGKPTDTLEPGMIQNLPPGRQVTFGTPPATNDHQSFAAAALRGVAAGIGSTYEDLTGDYSQVNFSSARMGRNAHQADVHDWRWNMLIPQFCAPAWAWMLEVAIMAGESVDQAPAEWTPPPVPMIDPDKEGLALQRMVRTGAKTHDEMVREQGYDPDEFWDEYAAGLKRLDEKGISLDSDVRRVSAAGQAQSMGAKKAGPNGATGNEEPAGGPPAADGAGEDAPAADA